jgi:hypothetical protein
MAYYQTNSEKVCKTKPVFLFCPGQSCSTKRTIRFERDYRIDSQLCNIFYFLRPYIIEIFEKESRWG